MNQKSTQEEMVVGRYKPAIPRSSSTSHSTNSTNLAPTQRTVTTKRSDSVTVRVTTRTPTAEPTTNK